MMRIETQLLVASRGSTWHELARRCRPRRIAALWVTPHSEVSVYLGAKLVMTSVRSEKLCTGWRRIGTLQPGHWLVVETADPCRVVAGWLWE